MRKTKNAIQSIAFPDTVEQGFQVVLGSRLEQYLDEHPSADQAEAWAAARATIQSAATPLRVDAIVNGTEQRLNVIATLPTDVQMAMGNQALELEFITLDNEPPIEFGDPLLASWVADCSEELFEAVYAYFQAAM